MGGVYVEQLDSNLENQIEQVTFVGATHTHKNFRISIYPEKRLINEKLVDTHDQPLYKPFFQPKTVKGIAHVVN